MKLSDAGAELLENFEGFRARPYRDSVGVWTIGFGSTKGVGPNTPPITRSAARARMKREVDNTYGAAVNALGLPPNQNQYDALCSFVYNLGPGAIGPSTGIGRALRNRQWKRAADELLEWDKAGGQRLEGLSRRRRAERALFLNPGVKPDPLKGLSAPERKIARGRIRHEREIRAGRNLAANRRWSKWYRVRIRAQQRRLWLAAKARGWGGGRGARWQILDGVVEGRIR